LLDSARLELRELKTRSTLLGACTICPVPISDLEATAVEIKDLKHKLDHSSRYTVLSLSCEACVSLKGKLLHATKENTKLQQEIAYLTTCLEKTALSEKMIEENLSRVEESATKSTHRLGVGFERCEKKGEKSASMFVPSFSCLKEQEALKPTKVHYPSNPNPSFNPKREKERNPQAKRGSFYLHVLWPCWSLRRFFFRWKRIERRHVEYARDSYRDEFIDFLPHSYSHVPPRFYSRALSRTFSRALPQFAHGPNHRSYGFGP
jgi:hypothetical protein